MTKTFEQLTAQAKERYEHYCKQTKEASSAEEEQVKWINAMVVEFTHLVDELHGIKSALIRIETAIDRYEDR